RILQMVLPRGQGGRSGRGAETRRDRLPSRPADARGSSRRRGTLDRNTATRGRDHGEGHLGRSGERATGRKTEAAVRESSDAGHYQGQLNIGSVIADAASRSGWDFN